MTSPRNRRSPLFIRYGRKDCCQKVSRCIHCFVAESHPEPCQPCPLETRIIGYARSKLSKEKLNDQLFWKIRDDAEQGHRKEDAKKMKEFEELVKYVQGSYDKDEAFLELER